MPDIGQTRTLLLGSAGIIVAALAIAAQAQTVTSPFAKKNKKQAWETQETPANAQSAPAQSIQATQYQTQKAAPQDQAAPQAFVPAIVPAPVNPAPLTYAAPPQQQAPTAAPQSRGSSTVISNNWQPSYSSYNYPPLKSAAPQQTQSATSLAGGNTAPANGAYFPGRSQGSTGSDGYKPTLRGPAYTGPQNFAPPVQTAPNNQFAASGSNSSGQFGAGGPFSGGPYAQSGPYSDAPPPASMPQKPYKPSWAERLGLSNLINTLTGYLRFGAAGTENNGWDADFIVDGAARGEVSASTQGGLEYGAGMQIRAQYDKHRRGFGGRVSDCPPTLAGCNSTLTPGGEASLRGHTSQFYASGPSNAKDTEFAVEGAYLFLRSAYGDITAGWDDGAAYLFSLGAPTLLAVGASNSPVDYTGLDSVKTINDASGFAEKITYISPRLLGDTIGVGVQFGASYSPNAKSCGVDYCVRANGQDVSGALSPDLKDVMEFGVALDRKFDNGFSVEATATYAMASEDSAIAEFDDLKALGLGLELGYNDFTLGGSYLDSNNGLANGDYTAWDAGLTWQPSKLGFTAGYGQAKDKNVNLKSNQAVFGVSYDWNEHYRLGTGVQYIERTTPFNMGGVLTPTKEKATAIFIEGRVTF